MEKILMLYYPLLDPVMTDPDAVLWAYYRHGCRIIEVALPYENPVLDGETVRASMARILKKSDIGQMFAAIRRTKATHPYIKVQIMSYIEVIESMGYEVFADLCKESHVDYVLAPNASARQLGRLDQVFAVRYKIPVIRFIPYADQGDLLKKAMTGQGYLFLQSGDAKSGGYQEIGEGLKTRIAYLRKHKIELPVIVGFGIKSYEQIRACHQCGADGVAVGSSLICYIAEGKTDEYLASLTGMTD